MGSNGGNKYIKAKEKKVNAVAVAHTVTADAAKIRHKNSGELQKNAFSAILLIYKQH